jgi:hypothetical protein
VKDFTLTRAIIQMDMVKDINGKKEFPLGADKIGYVRINEFGDKTGDELEDALQKLKGQGMKALILDLRFNPGGLLDEAVNVCGKFLPRGQLVVTTEGRDPRENSVRRAEGRGDELKGEPMVVLVNLGSASAAEIVTGCLQDLHRANHSRRENVWQRFRAKHFSARRRLGAQTHRRQVLHAEPQGHSRARHHAGHRRADERRAKKPPCSSNAFARRDLNRWMKRIARA